MWEDGVYYNIDLTINKHYLVVRAETPGKVIFTGTSSANIGGSYNVIEGFQWLGGDIKDRWLITVIGSYNEFKHLNLKDYYCTKYFVLRDVARFNNLSYCNFEHRAFIGDQNILSILVHPFDPGYNTLSYCSFRDFPGGGGDDGMEPIRIGLSAQGDYISRTTVEYCYFEQCNGDGEIISHKSRQNVYRYNTFNDNPVGELVLRHGDEGIVYGNFFLNGMGGVRIKEGQGHAVFNNYFYNTSKHPLLLQNHSADPLADITIAYNTFVDCSSYVRLGSSGAYPPSNITFANNIFARSNGNNIEDATGDESWIGNISIGDLGITRPAGIADTDPLLTANAYGFFEPGAGSPAIDAAESGYPDIPSYENMGIDAEVLMDIMQQERPANIEEKDVGCSEAPYTNSLKPLVNGTNTGPSYLQDEDYVYVHVSKNGNGSVVFDPPGGVYEKGTTVSVTAVPEEGYYEFESWGGDLSGTDSSQTLLVDGNKKVIVNFSAVPLQKVEVFIFGEGTVEANPPAWHYLKGSEVTLTAIPAEGYNFDYWSGDFSGSDNPLSIQVRNSLTGFAYFILNTSVETIDSDHIVSFYPNPAERYLFVEFNTEPKQCIVRVFNWQGHQIANAIEFSNIEEGKLKLDVAELSSGLYTAQVLSEKNTNKALVLKFVKL